MRLWCQKRFKLTSPYKYCNTCKEYIEISTKKEMFPQKKISLMTFLFFQAQRNEEYLINIDNETTNHLYYFKK